MPHHHAAQGHDRAKSRFRLACTLAMTLAYMLAEVAGGLVAGSLALLADAGHMLSDAAALGLSLFAMWIAQRAPTSKHSFGYYRAEILAALLNGAALVAIAIIVVVEAVARLSHPHVVEGRLMMAVSVGGLAVNLAGMALLHEGRKHSLNLHGAWLHLMTDALGSVAALAAGAAIALAGWHWADPVASIVIAVLVAFSSWGILAESISILMESTPRHLDVDQVRDAMAAVAGVTEIHDLHVWTITGGMVSLSAHVTLAKGHSPAEALAALRQTLHDRFGIDHMTIQIEPDDGQQCGTAFA